MLITLSQIARITAVLCIVGIAAAGCGRKGDLDRPSTPVELQNKRNQKAAPTPSKPFILDSLL
ncbi:MAG: lipoprotein [Rhizobium sp.]